ncbi:MAG: PAS domain S-box protein [Halorientalis sp.]
MKSGRVVLYVGDSHARVTETFRDREDWTVQRVATLEKAREKVPSADVVVADGELPDGEGIDVCDLRPNDAASLPVVLLPAGRGDPALARAAAERAATRYVPVDTLDGPADLRAVVEPAVAEASENRRYRHLVQQTTDVVLVIEPEGELEYVDPTVESMLGYDPAELEGSDGLSYVHPEDRDAVADALERIRSDPDESASLEFRVENADGEWQWTAGEAESLVEDAAVGGIVVTLRDVTERRERERELARYEAVVEAVDDLVFALDEEGKFTFVNEAHESVTGRDAEELLGSDPGVNVPEEDADRTKEVVTDLLESDSRSHATYEMDVITDDGDRIPCETHISLLTDDDGEFRGTAGVVRDVSDRKEQEHLYSTVVNKANDGIVITKDQTVEFANEQLAAMLGYDRSEMEGEPYYEFIAPGDREFLRENHIDDEPGASARFEVDLLDAEGERVPVEVNNTRVQYRGGLGELAIVRDISDRKERQRELERYETMLNAVPDMVYAADEDGNFLSVNDTAAAVTGYDRAEMVDEHVSLMMDESDIERGSQVIRDLLSSDGRDKGIFEMDIETAEGESIPAENHVAILTDRDGEFQGSVGMLRDISDRKRRERRLTVLNRALRHDLRNSMHVILANVDLVESEVADPAVASKLEMIRRRAEQISSLSEKAREIEHILGDKTGARKAIDIADLLDDQIDAFRERHPDATIEASLPDKARIEAIELVDLAVENLVENSIEHADDPTVEVDVSVSDDTVAVTVSDDGPGIPEKERRVVRQGSETPLDHASGLGLWLVAWITRDCGGEVVFDCGDGDGSAVRLEFERAPPADTAGEEATAPEAGERAD